MEPLVHKKPNALWLFISIVFPAMMAILSVGILIVEYPSDVLLWSAVAAVLMGASVIGLIRTRKQSVVLSEDHLEYSFLVVGEKIEKHDIETCVGMLIPQLRLKDGRSISLPYLRGLCPEIRKWLSA